MSKEICLSDSHCLHSAKTIKTEKIRTKKNEIKKETKRKKAVVD